jgi:iron complex outermembrane receptor protein
MAAAWTQAAMAQSSGDRPAAPDASVQTLSPVFVTHSPIGANLFELADPVNVLQGRGLLLKQQPTLGATLEQEVGVSATNFGPNASRPIIRGLGGFDIRLLNNGIGVLDASSASPDHAVAVSPFAVERIEVVRGPAAVMYGGGAIGGVVNTIDSRIALTPPERPFAGSASYRVDTQNNLSAGGARLDGGNQRFALHADAYATRNGDLKIPGAAWTAEVQAQRGEAGPTGTLPNSQGATQSYGLGATAFFGQASYAGVSYSRFSTNYGTVAEPDVTIDLTQQAWNFAGELRDALPGLQALRVKFGYNDYQHTEFENGAPGTIFKSNGWNLRVEGLNVDLGPLRGAIGLEAASVDFSALGDEAFVPSTRSGNLAAFVYEELQRDALKVSFGGRVERATIDAQAFVAAGLPAASASFTPWSAAVGAFCAFSTRWGVGANLQYTQRAPSSQELFADGPHLATNQFEVGNRALNKATSTSIDLTLKRNGEFFVSTVGAFYSDFSNFIGLFPTGIFRNPTDRSVAPGPAPYLDPVTGESVTPLQQFDYGQVRARFYGLEAQVAFPVWKAGVNLLSTKLQGDFVRATDRDNGQPLPFIPPLRVGASLTYQREALTATLGALVAAGQDRVPQFQTPTPGYTNVFLNASYRFMTDGTAELELFVQATNLLDDTIRYSTSNLKDIAPAGARAIMAGVRGAF